MLMFNCVVRRGFRAFWKISIKKVTEGNMTGTFVAGDSMKPAVGLALWILIKPVTRPLLLCSFSPDYYNLVPK